MQKDFYTTIKQQVEGIYKEKGSKFLSFAFPVESEDDIKVYIDDLKKKYYDARHHCYAWELGPDGNNFRMNDDGEPSGTAGKPILGQIHSFGLTNILVVVVRYFGGVKLGTGGLIQAYKAATADALEKAEQTECTIDKSFSIRFPYDLMNPVMRVIDEEGLAINAQKFEEKCRMTLAVRESKFESIIDRFRKSYGIEVIDNSQFRKA
ncbi:IMPACT family protein [Anaerophaga thermohalophila]|uniref:IMPACT family protein n=1 Tax=Anaerophaga thermohalophila TaxID=177400 RepID=UPI000492A810|nr:YigZ family protein [Anaerophaga thermohalophila]